MEWPSRQLMTGKRRPAAPAYQLLVLGRDDVPGTPALRGADVCAPVASRPIPADVDSRPPDLQTSAGLAAAIADLRARVADLEAAEAERRRRRLLPDDPPYLARLLPAVSGLYGSDVIPARYITEDPRLATVVKGRSTKALGKLFDRAIGVPIGMYVLVDCGKDKAEGVRLYRVDGFVGVCNPVDGAPGPAESTAP